MKQKIEYYVTPIDGSEVSEWWRSRYYKRISAPKWEKLKDEDDIEKILKTHRYSFDFYPDNDDFHQEIEFDVIVKKITTTENIICNRDF